MNKLFWTFCILSFSALVIDAQQSLKDPLDKDIRCSTKTQKDHKAANQPATPQISTIGINNNSLSGKNEQTPDDKKNVRPEKTIEEKTLETNKWMVGVGILQLIVFGFQGWVLWKTVKSADKTTKSMQNSERAYLFGEINGSIIPNRQYVELVISIKNHGKTPALLTSFHAFPWSGGETPSLSDITKTEYVPLGGFVIGAGETENWPLSIETKSANMKILCMVEYNDIFHNSHVTNFCWEYKESTGAFDLSSNKDLTNYT